VPQLIHVADTNTNLTVRKEAFFWLGQSQDPRALAYLEQVLKNRGAHSLFEVCPETLSGHP